MSGPACQEYTGACWIWMWGCVEECMDYGFPYIGYPDNCNLDPIDEG